MQGSNIGFAVYARGEEPGTLDYYLESGVFSDEYDLEIERTGERYDVRWLVDGEISAVGVGMEVGDRLAVGWRRVADHK